MTPLYYAIHNDNYNLAVYLISKGASVNTKDEIGDTPLHDAASFGSIPMIKLFVAHHASLDARDKNGKRPIDCASKDAIRYFKQIK